MDASVGRSCSGAAVTIVVLAALICAGSASAQRYAYSDDFSTDKAMVDSYLHSDFLQELPDPWPVSGFLRYEWYQDNRMLTFYYGSGHDSQAWLKYRFPLDGGAGTYSSAVVHLSLVHNWYGYGWIQCYCSLEGGSMWEWPVCADEGPCAFEFFGEAPSDTVEIWLRGTDVTIDNLIVELGGETPMGRDSWTTIKRLFGGPPN
jgi:hypothetical protein